MTMNIEETHYTILGVESTVERAEVRKAFRHLALECHPDKVESDDREAATGRFQRVLAAYAVLNDDAQRIAYDKGLAKEREKADREKADKEREKRAWEARFDEATAAAREPILRQASTRSNGHGMYRERSAQSSASRLSPPPLDRQPSHRSTRTPLDGQPSHRSTGVHRGQGGDELDRRPSGRSAGLDRERSTRSSGLDPDRPSRGAGLDRQQSHRSQRSQKSTGRGREKKTSDAHEQRRDRSRSCDPPREYRHDTDEYFARPPYPRHQSHNTFNQQPPLPPLPTMVPPLPSMSPPTLPRHPSHHSQQSRVSHHGHSHSHGQISHMHTGHEPGTLNTHGPGQYRHNARPYDQYQFQYQDPGHALHDLPPTHPFAPTSPVRHVHQQSPQHAHYPPAHLHTPPHSNPHTPPDPVSPPHFRVQLNDIRKGTPAYNRAPIYAMHTRAVSHGSALDELLNHLERDFDHLDRSGAGLSRAASFARAASAARDMNERRRSSRLNSTNLGNGRPYGAPGTAPAAEPPTPASPSTPPPPRRPSHNASNGDRVCSASAPVTPVALPAQPPAAPAAPVPAPAPAPSQPRKSESSLRPLRLDTRNPFETPPQSPTVRRIFTRGAGNLSPTERRGSTGTPDSTLRGRTASNPLPSLALNASTGNVAGEGGFIKAKLAAARLKNPFARRRGSGDNSAPSSPVGAVNPVTASATTKAATTQFPENPVSPGPRMPVTLSPAPRPVPVRAVPLRSSSTPLAFDPAPDAGLARDSSHPVFDARSGFLHHRMHRPRTHYAVL